jgi:hypothetical protein
MHAIKRQGTVSSNGNLQLLDLPIPLGTTVEVILLVPDAEETSEDLVNAAMSSTSFWDNPIDDRVWNDA